MPRKKRRRAKGLGTAYRRGQVWSISWVSKGVRLYEHGLPDEDTARRVLTVKIGDVAAGRGGITKPRASGPLGRLVDDWLVGRVKTHRSANQDRLRWKKHLEPVIGKYAPDDVDVGMLKKLITAKLADGLSPATVRLLVRLVSTIYSALIDDGKATKNPAKMLPKATKRLLKPSYDPKKTPFVPQKKDVARLFRALFEAIPTVGIAYAVSALAGLRPGEARALRWENVDVERRSIYVRESVDGPTKDKDAREAPIVSSLAEVLKRWRVKSRGALVCPPLRATGEFLDDSTIRDAIRGACKELKLTVVDGKTGKARAPTFYEAGRHTFASQWVLSGGSIEKLREILGCSTVLVTERYAHLEPELFGAADLERANVPLDG
jgi:integrase